MTREGLETTRKALETRLRRTLPDARIDIAELPGCPELRLGLLNGDYQTGPLDPEVMHAVIQKPAYWAFCWGSGLALARFLLTTPAWVEGRSVVDLGSGSGVAAIAAARAGAAEVVACDLDEDALAAVGFNAALNDVRIRTTTVFPDRADLVLMADVLYDRSNLPLLASTRRRAREILVADSRVTTLPDPDYREITRIEALTVPNLGEFDEFRYAHVFHWRAGGAIGRSQSTPSSSMTASS